MKIISTQQSSLVAGGSPGLDALSGLAAMMAFPLFSMKDYKQNGYLVGLMVSRAYVTAEKMSPISKVSICLASSMLGFAAGAIQEYAIESYHNYYSATVTNQTAV